MHYGPPANGVSGTPWGVNCLSFVGGPSCNFLFFKGQQARKQLMPLCEHDMLKSLSLSAFPLRTHLVRLFYSCNGWTCRNMKIVVMHAWCFPFPSHSHCGPWISIYPILSLCGDIVTHHFNSFYPLPIPFANLLLLLLFWAFYLVLQWDQCD